MRFLLLTASLTMAEADTRHRARSSRLVRHELSSLGVSLEDLAKSRAAVKAALL